MDNTITPSSDVMLPEMGETLKAISRKGYKLGLVTGSTKSKIFHQMPLPVLDHFDFIFPEIGLCSIINRKDGSEPIETSQSMISYLGIENYHNLTRFLENYCRNYPFPVKTSEFIRTRVATINITPMGRTANSDQKKWFDQYNKENGTLSKIVKELTILLQKKFPEIAQKIYMPHAGRTSIEIYPIGCDKTLCLKYLSEVK
jgi:phosphomannomutase